MTKSIKIFALILIFFTSQFFYISYSFADNETEELIHLVVLADISGSLQTIDTKELQQLIQKLPNFLNNDKLNRSKLSIIAFSSEAVQICETKEAKELKTTDGSKFFRDCTNKIQSSRSDNPEKDNRVQGIGNDTNQIKAFERGLEVISNDTENYVPVFLLLTDGALDPLDTGANSPEASIEYERGYLNIAPKMIDNNVQLFIFGFGNAKASDLNTWLGFSAERRACQEENPQRVYLNEENRTVSQLLASINTAMKQVTCGESKELVVLKPGEPYVFYVSDLAETIEIKINLNEIDGVQPVVTDSSGQVLGENNFDEECQELYVFCYQESNPVKGDWSATTEIFDQSTATGYSLIAMEKSFYGTFKITSNCITNTLKNGIDKCVLELVSSRPNATDLNLAISKAIFNAKFLNSGLEEEIEFLNSQLTVNAFEGKDLNSGFNELTLQPSTDEFNIDEQFKWLQYSPSKQWSFEVISTTTTTLETIEEVTASDEEQNFPWLLLIATLFILLLFLYFSSRKRDLPFGNLEYYNRSNQMIGRLNIGDIVKEEYFELTISDETIKLENIENKKDANLILSSNESFGIEIFTDRDRTSGEVKLTYIDPDGKKVAEKGYPDVEIHVSDEFKVKFIADEAQYEYNQNIEDEGDFSDFEFDD